MKMRRFGPLFVCTALMTAAATAALAQVHDLPTVTTRAPPKPFEVRPPTVEGAGTTVSALAVEATQPGALRKQTYDFVQLYGATSVKLDQIARWTQKLCVTVQGIDSDAAADVKGRIEEVAKALNLGLQPAGCTANIQVMFTGEPQALLDRVANEHERLLGYWHHRDRLKLKTVTRPIQAWYVTGTGGTGGNTTGLAFATIETGGVANAAGNATAPTVAPKGTSGRSAHGVQLDDEDNTEPGPTGCGDNSHFTGCLTSEFEHVLVVVDTKKVQDLGPGAIADYVVMLAMAQPKSLDGCNVLPSVVDLFAKGCRPVGTDGLTRADVAYLTALYKTDLEAKKTSQFTDIAGRMADMLIKAQKVDRVAAGGGR